jgi:unsaturated rhamnogalacturonyl hydrolase
VLKRVYANMSEDLLKRVVARTMRLPFHMWRFGEEIAVMGLIAAARRLHDPEPTGFVTALLRAYVARGVGRMPEEHIAPARALVFAYEVTKDPEFVRAAGILADRHFMYPAIASGARIHRPDLPGWRRQIWVDCMSVDAPFLVHLSQVVGREDYRREAIAQLNAYSQLLQEPETGLFRHSFEGHCGPNGELWARGNGWALLGLVETAAPLPLSDPDRQNLCDRLAHLCRALARFQNAGGLWHTVIPRSDTYVESTLAAMAAYGLREAFETGCLDSGEFGEMERKARCAVTELIKEDGSLDLVSDATPVGEFRMYATRSFGVFPWGQGPLLLMLSQVTDL